VIGERWWTDTNRDYRVVASGCFHWPRTEEHRGGGASASRARLASVLFLSAILWLGALAAELPASGGSSPS
jgi:hypothetical protein